jgi:hypothetical protein
MSVLSNSILGVLVVSGGEVVVAVDTVHGVNVGADGDQLVCDEHFGFVVQKVVQGGGEYWHTQRTGSSCQSSRSRLSR